MHSGRFILLSLDFPDEEAERIFVVKKLCALLLSVFFCGPCFQLAAETSKMHEISYRGIHPDDPGGRCGLRNPERGFRLEIYIGQPPGSATWGTAKWQRERITRGFSDDWWLTCFRRYAPYGVTMAQAYCYLDKFEDKPLSPEKLALLDRSLARCREAGVKVLLRFAYERTMQRKSGPTVQRILAHLDQLAPLIRKNSDVIFVLQAGMVGAWGEWHSSACRIEEDHHALAAIVKKELSILPPGRMLQLRVLPRYKRWVLEDPLLNGNVPVTAENAFSGIPAARIGMGDDGFLAGETDGGTWTEPPFYAQPGNPEFDAFTRESPYLAVDGELFWSDQGGKIDGLRAIKRLRLHHYTSLSLTHGYSDYEGEPYSIDQWKKTPITLEAIAKNNLPQDKDYFTNRDGSPAVRTQFEYIRDHLGYRIELQHARFPEKVAAGKPLPVEVSLINRGFATLINPRKVYLALINTAGELVRTRVTSANPQSWQPFRPGDPDYCPLEHRVQGTVDTTGLAAGEYLVGLWMPDTSKSLEKDARYAVRVANGDVPWWETASGEYGINILGRVKIQ